jgi:hypothetical protein
MLQGDASALWERVGELFAEADGSLPDIALGGLTAADVGAVARVLAAHAADVAGATTLVMQGGEIVEVPVPLPSFAAAAAEVAAGQRASFHAVLSDVQVHGVKVPDLGVFVFADEVTLDYEPGPAWCAAALGALCDLLAAIRSAAPSARVEADRHFTPEWRDRFAAAIAQYAVPGGAG